MASASSGSLPPVFTFNTLSEIVARARDRLEPQVWDYLCGGSASETTLLRNRLALDSLALRPRVLRNVRDVDCSAQVLGVSLRMPVMLSPIGALQMFDPDGSLASARAAAAFGTAAFVGVLGHPALEIVAARSGGPQFFQLYVRGDKSWIRGGVDRVRASGYRALCLTVDTARYSPRDRDLVNRFAPATAVDRPDVSDVLGRDGDDHQAATDWDLLAWIRDIAGMPICIKGVMTGEDARQAVDAGMSAVYVSNHGGRQLDQGEATIDVLPEIVDAVGSRADVIVDSGFMRGTDVVKALALGAQGVAIGELQGLALAAGGSAAVVRAFELLEMEIKTSMALVGAASIPDLKPSMIATARPVRLPTATSAFPLLP
ncbi:alpha-hydroxy acid oxidase [soil metagenome]